MVPGENCKFVSVESCQSLVGAQPEITIAGLSNGADSVLRKALLLRPDGYRILRERLVGIEGHGGVNPTRSTNRVHIRSIGVYYATLLRCLRMIRGRLRQDEP